MKRTRKGPRVWAKEKPRVIRMHGRPYLETSTGRLLDPNQFAPEKGRKLGSWVTDTIKVGKEIRKEGAEASQSGRERADQLMELKIEKMKKAMLSLGLNEREILKIYEREVLARGEPPKKIVDLTYWEWYRISKTKAVAGLKKRKKRAMPKTLKSNEIIRICKCAGLEIGSAPGRVKIKTKYGIISFVGSADITDPKIIGIVLKIKKELERKKKG